MGQRRARLDLGHMVESNMGAVPGLWHTETIIFTIIGWASLPRQTLKHRAHSWFWVLLRLTHAPLLLPTGFLTSSSGRRKSAWRVCPSQQPRPLHPCCPNSPPHWDGLWDKLGNCGPQFCGVPWEKAQRKYELLLGRCWLLLVKARNLQGMHTANVITHSPRPCNSEQKRLHFTSQAQSDTFALMSGANGP